jgi:TDG/mug DNA glycosylase family protein
LFGLIPYKLTPNEFRKLTEHGIGLTDLVKHESGNDSVIHPTAADIKILRDKIELYKPAILAFNGKTPAKYFLGHVVEYGFQIEGIDRTKIYVLPSTSRQAVRYWSEEHWHKLALSLGGFSG